MAEVVEKMEELKLDDNVIITIRHDELIEKIIAWSKENNIKRELLRNILDIIIHECSTGYAEPKQIIYDLNIVENILKKHEEKDCKNI